MDNYLLPSNGIAALLAALGLSALSRRLPGAGKAFLFSAAFLGLALSAKSLFPFLDFHRQVLRYDYGANLLKSVPRNGVLFAEEDEDYFPVFYLQALEHRRPDVRMIPSFTLFEPWGVRQVERLHPGLGLTASLVRFPDHFARIIYASSEIVVKSRGRRAVCFSYFDGAFHRYYLDLHPSLRFQKSGVALVIHDPSLPSQALLALGGLRLRNFRDDPSDFHPILAGIWSAYRTAGLFP
jgi:hypothetical protein